MKETTRPLSSLCLLFWSKVFRADLHLRGRTDASGPNWLRCVCGSADERVGVWEAAAAAASHAETSFFQHESRCFSTCIP